MKIRNTMKEFAIINKDFAKAYSTMRWISQIEGVWKNEEDNTK